MAERCCGLNRLNGVFPGVTDNEVLTDMSARSWKKAGEHSSAFFVELIKSKRAQRKLRPFGNRTPGNNRYRCFLSDLAGLAA